MRAHLWNGSGQIQGRIQSQSSEALSDHNGYLRKADGGLGSRGGDEIPRPVAHEWLTGPWKMASSPASSFAEPSGAWANKHTD